MRASAPVAAELGQAVLTGATSFEVAEPDPGGDWAPVGPNANGGELDVGAGPNPHTYMLSPNYPVIWVSEDATASWRARRVTTVTDASPIELVPDPGRPGVLYLALTSTATEQTFEGQILRSDDDGRTWTSLPAPDVDMRDLEVVAGGELLAAATAAGLYAGTRGGADWDPVTGPWKNVAATELVGADLYAATDAGLFVDRRLRPRRPDGATRRRLRRDALRAGDAAMPACSSPATGTTCAARPTAAARGASSSRRRRAAGSGRCPSSAGPPTSARSRSSGSATASGSRWQRRERPLPSLSVGDVRAHPSGGLLVATPQAGVFASTDGARTYRRVGTPGVPTIDLAIAENAAGHRG